MMQGQYLYQGIQYHEYSISTTASLLRGFLHRVWGDSEDAFWGWQTSTDFRWLTRGGGQLHFVSCEGKGLIKKLLVRAILSISM